MPIKKALTKYTKERTPVASTMKDDSTTTSGQYASSESTIKASAVQQNRFQAMMDARMRQSLRKSISFASLPPFSPTKPVDDVANSRAILDEELNDGDNEGSSDGDIKFRDGGLGRKFRDAKGAARTLKVVNFQKLFNDANAYAS